MLKLAEKVNNIDISGFVLKSKYDLKAKTKYEFLILANLLKKHYNNKITEIENKIPSISGLATNVALMAVENKTPNISSVVKKKKTGYNTKFTEAENKLTNQNHDKYITTPEFNKLTAKNFAARLKQANLITTIDFDDKLKSLSRKIYSNNTEH